MKKKLCIVQSNQFMIFSVIYFSSDVDTVSLEFEAPPEALQASHLRMRPVKETEEKHRRKRRKGTTHMHTLMHVHT